MAKQHRIFAVQNRPKSLFSRIYKYVLLYRFLRVGSAITMELRHLRYFVVAAEEENFHRAAARLHVAQPALSRRIRDLETELGYILFDRHQKRVRLSNAGQAYFEQIKPIFKALDNAKEQTRRVARGDYGLFRLGFPESAFRSPIIIESIHQFRSSFPNVEIKLEPVPPSHGLDGVSNGDLDACFVLNRCDASSAIDHLAIDKQEWVLAMPTTHPLVGQPAILLAQLKDEPFVWTRRDVFPTLHDRLMAACTAGGLTPQIVQYTVNESTRLHLIAIGMGIGFVSSSIREAPIGVTLRKIADFYSPLELDLVWRRDFCPPTVEHFKGIISTVKKASHDLDDRQRPQAPGLRSEHL
jgi:DNA-binding transcriptional LysR family regulator